jgi:hypothetical protein
MDFLADFNGLFDRDVQRLKLDGENARVGLSRRETQKIVEGGDAGTL